MKCIGIAVVVFLKILCVQSRMLEIRYLTTRAASTSDSDETGSAERSESVNEKFGLRPSHEETEEYPDYDKKHSEPSKKPCGVVVVANMPSPNKQSLLRKYRYDANGILIPSSVKYYIKLPQGGLEEPPILLPLNEKTFSPLGGFVRYYKKVPPIPQSW